jgi:hypothetical protein
VATAVFANAIIEVDNPISGLQLPGNLLQHTPNLTTCEAMFYDLKCPYSLSQSEFDQDWNIVNNI